MKRRDFVKNLSYSSAALTVIPSSAFDLYLTGKLQVNKNKALRQIEKLDGENGIHAKVKTERGGPRLFINRNEIYPFFALSTHMYPTIKNYRQAGLNIYAPIIGMYSGWLGPKEYDWTNIDVFFGHLLELNPESFFMPRLQLNTPIWWKKTNPDELLQYGLEAPIKNYNLIEKRNLKPSEGGFFYRTSAELWEVSYASEKWRQDTAAMLRAFMRHIEDSPLCNRIFGYMPTTGRTGEWNTFGPDFLPDYSEPMRRTCGKIPDVKERLTTTFGLLRDPEKERKVIEFYQKYHDTIADTALLMCQTIKDATKGRVLTGVFYGYLLEQVRIQEGGYLAMRKFLESPYIDYIAGPYSYMPGNVKDGNGVRVTTQDGAGNILGNARGLAGDGGFRMMTESLRRHGKLYFSEMDPSTNLDKNPHQVIGGHGGEGSDTATGSLRIMQRDLGQMFACGVGGWLYDFGPLNQAENGWYAGKDIIREINYFVKLGERRKKLDISPVAEIAVIADDRTFTATEHWQTGKPWKNYAIKSSDFFNHWFLNSQARAFHRIGAPVDFLYHHDLKQKDLLKYKLIFMTNLFFFEDAETNRLCRILRNSGATVIWYYAPGFITPDKLNLKRMEKMTGFHFKIIKEPGPMLIDLSIENENLPMQLKFGVDTQHWPRFVITDKNIESWGIWDDLGETALAGKEYDGYFSVYTGTAPLPIPVLSWLTKLAKVQLWSTESDIVRATQDAAMLVATTTGKRTFTLHKPMSFVNGEETKRMHELDLEKGEVRIFTI
jgi:hypothetical protein